MQTVKRTYRTRCEKFGQIMVGGRRRLNRHKREIRNTYRKTNDESKFLKHCKDFLNHENKFIITLSDKDIISMLNIKLAEEKVDDYVEDKMEQLLT